MSPASQPSPKPARTRGPAPNVQRRAAKRRKALGERFRNFDAALPALSLERLSVPALDGSQIGFTGFVWSKLISLALLAAAVTALVWVQTDFRWYVYRDNVQIGGLNRIAPDEVFALSELDGWNIFWLQGAEVRERVLRHPWVGDVDVTLSAPNGVALTIKEDPAVGVWVTDKGQFWISPRGAALPVTEAPALDMPRLIDASLDAAVPGSEPGTAVNTDVVASALALIERVPGVSEVRFSSEIGLNFGLPGTTLWVYWGEGDRPEEKLDAIELGRQMIASREMEASVLDVRFPERPFLR